MDRIQDLDAFIAIVERGTLTAAAHHLGRSLQSVSRSLATLERSAGTELVRRTTRRARPTDTGLRFYERVRPVVAELAEARADLLNESAEPAGRIRFAAPVMFTARYVAPVIARFVRQHPKIEIDLQLSDRFSDLIDDDLDLALRIGTLADSGLVGRRLGNLRLCWFGSPEYFARHGRPKHPRDLSDHDCVIRTSDREPGRWYYREDSALHSVHVQGRVRANDAGATNAAVSEGAGIGFGPLWQIKDQIDAGTLVPILQPFEPAPVPIHLLWPASKLMRSRVRLLIDHLAQNLETG